MTQQHYLRTVEIRTVRGTCDDCGATAGPAARDTLLGWGWTLSNEGDPDARDRCPDCAALARARVRRAEENAARARLIAQGAEIARAFRCIVDDGGRCS